jgi:myo-inositol 2-dehydrogenase/D-chiro-inositol 1-dehydrogenase
VPDAELVLVADPFGDSAQRLAGPLGADSTTDIDSALADGRVEAVAITSTSTVHADLVQRAAAAGKAVWCEKPMAMTLAEADAAVAACEQAAVPLQVGFNRRFSPDFAAAHEVVAAGGIGTPQLLRSLTRDPGLADPGAVPPWTIFTQTLIHDFDMLLWFNAGSRPVEVHAYADALVAPDFKEAGLLDTAVVTIRFDNGAIATAEASFSALSGHGHGRDPPRTWPPRTGQLPAWSSPPPVKTQSSCGTHTEPSCRRSAGSSARVSRAQSPALTRARRSRSP